jgi:outer membrane protein OmpA-like peptidoglycan-associated protein
MKLDLRTVAAGLLGLTISVPARASAPASEDAGPEAPAEGDEASASEPEPEPEPEPGPDDDADAGPEETEPAEPADGVGVTASGSSKSTETDVERPDLADEPEPTPAKEAKPKRERSDIPWIRRWRPERHLVELGIYGGVLFPNEDHDLYDPATRPPDPLWAAGADVGLRLGYFPLRPLGIEAEFSANPTRVRTFNDDFAFVYGFRGHVVAQLPFYSVIPFFLAGYGLMGVRSHVLVLGNDIDPAFHYGGGLKINATKFVGFRVEVRNIVSAAEARQNSGTSHVQVLGGLTITFNRKKPVVKPPPPVIDPDRDKDGILNEKDDCPDTPGIEPHGCPDTDGDGFIDSVDECPEVPGVAPKGCPDKDSDGDGIMDSVDQCPFEPETFNGLEDEDGCPDELPPKLREFEGTLEGIQFDFNEATIRPVSKPILDDAIKTLEEFEFIKIQVVGHTDNVGTDAFNDALSERRAEAVKEYFVAGGIDASRIETEGKGASAPRDTNDTEAGRARNRRIEIVITKRREDAPAKKATDED